MSSNKRSIPHFAMFGEILVIAFIIIYLLFSGRKAADSTTSFDDMKKALEPVINNEQLDDAGAQTLKRLYGLNESDYEGVLLKVPSSAMGAEELLLVKLKDREQMDTVYEAIMGRLESQLNSFEGYGAEQTEMLNSALIITKGNYALLSVGDDNELIKEAFDNNY